MHPMCYDLIHGALKVATASVSLDKIDTSEYLKYVYTDYQSTVTSVFMYSLLESQRGINCPC